MKLPQISTVSPIEEDTMRPAGRKIARICAFITLVLFAVIMLRLAFAALFSTVDMNMENSAKENVVFHQDSFLYNLIMLACGIALLFLYRRYARCLSLGTVMFACVFIVTMVGIWFVMSSQSAPTNDSYIVSDAAYGASIGDYTALSGNYFKRFPFQLGYVLWSELLIRVFSLGNRYLGIEIINVICLAISYFAIIKTTEHTFHDPDVVRLTALLLTLFAAPIMFCTFVYGNIPGLMFGTLALWQVSVIRKNWRSYLHASIAALCIALAVCIKKNLLIFWVTMVIILLIRFIRERGFAPLVCILLSVISVIFLPVCVQKYYKHRSGIEFGDGIPMVSWMAMGLNDAYIAPGWYNSKYTVTNFHNNDMDTNKAADASLEVIKERLDYLSENKTEAYDFFSKKIDSQWNEPTYQSIWTNNVRGHYGDMGELATFLCVEHEDFTKAAMNLYQQLILVLAAVSAFVLFHRREITHMLFPVIIIGGFLYHLIFEAKSQYIITYLILAIPLSAVGLNALYKLCAPRIAHIKDTFISCIGKRFSKSKEDIV